MVTGDQQQNESPIPYLKVGEHSKRFSRRRTSTVSSADNKVRRKTDSNGFEAPSIPGVTSQELELDLSKFRQNQRRQSWSGVTGPAMFFLCGLGTRA